MNTRYGVLTALLMKVLPSYLVNIYRFFREGNASILRVMHSGTGGLKRNLKIGTIRCFGTSATSNLSARCNSSEESNLPYNYTDQTVF